MNLRTEGGHFWITFENGYTLSAFNGYSPTLSELAMLLKCSTRPVFEKLMILEEKGYISTINGKARTIKILKGCDEE